jgi:hypothetical protein
VHAGSPQLIDYSSPCGRHYQQCAFSRRRLQQPWRVHQPVLMLVRGLDGKGSGPWCQYKKCPGLIKIQAQEYHLKYSIDVRSVV